MVAAVSTKKPRVTIVLDEELLDRLQAQAEKEMRTVSQMGAILMLEALNAREGK